MKKNDLMGALRALLALWRRLIQPRIEKRFDGWLETRQVVFSDLPRCAGR